MIGYGLGSERITPAALWVEGAEAEAGGTSWRPGVRCGAASDGSAVCLLGSCSWDVEKGAGPSPPGAGGAQSAWALPWEAAPYPFGFGHGERLETSRGDVG